MVGLPEPARPGSPIHWGCSPISFLYHILRELQLEVSASSVAFKPQISWWQQSQPLPGAQQGTPSGTELRSWRGKSGTQELLLASESHMPGTGRPGRGTFPCLAGQAGRGKQLISRPMAE